jgi:hydrogenase maturation protease
LRNAVIGIGNLLRADDGVGIHVVKMLKDERPDIEAVDMSTAEIEILEHIRGCDNVVIIDSIMTGAEPGTIHMITPQDLEPSSFARSHGLNLSSTLLLGSRLFPDEMPKKIVILTVEAEDINSFSTELTPKVQSAIPRLLDLIFQEFDETES